MSGVAYPSSSILNPFNIDSVPTTFNNYPTLKNIENNTKQNKDFFGNAISSVYTSLITNNFNNDQISSIKYSTVSTGTSSATVSGGLCTITNSTGTGDYFLLRSKKNIRYRSGYITTSTHAVAFDSPTANTLQLNGLGTASNDVYFGYNSSGNFHFRVSKNGVAEVRTLTISAASAGVETGTLTLDGTIYTIPLTNAGGDLNYTAHEIEDYMLNNQTSWDRVHIDNTVLFASNSVGPRTGTYSFSSTGSAAGTIAQNKLGIVLTTQEMEIANFNGDSTSINGLNPQTINMYKIDVSFYGIGNIQLSLYDDLDEIYKPLHTFRFTNSQSLLNLSDPNFYIQNIVSDFGANVSKSMLVGGQASGYVGSSMLNNFVPYSFQNSKSISSSTETNILVIAHNDVINNVFCQNEIIAKALSVSSDGNKNVLIKVVLNPNISPTPSTSDFTNYQKLDDFSLALYDTTSDTYSGGRVLFTTSLAKSDNIIIDLLNYDIVLGKDDTLVVSAFSTSASDVGVSITWGEDV